MAPPAVSALLPEKVESSTVRSMRAPKWMAPPSAPLPSARLSVNVMCSRVSEASEGA